MSGPISTRKPLLCAQTVFCQLSFFGGWVQPALTIFSYALASDCQEFKHRRTASAQSTVSTVVPEDNISDSEEEEDEVPQEVRGCTDIRQFAKKALPGLPCSRTSMPARLAPPVLGPL
ncbi:unnamed protein product [Effrenium voratum]|nr:unnamed protein product [Effrenium voratum]